MIIYWLIFFYWRKSFNLPSWVNLNTCWGPIHSNKGSPTNQCLREKQACKKNLRVTLSTQKKKKKKPKWYSFVNYCAENILIFAINYKIFHSRWMPYLTFRFYTWYFGQSAVKHMMIFQEPSKIKRILSIYTEAIFLFDRNCFSF